MKITFFVACLSIVLGFAGATSAHATVGRTFYALHGSGTACWSTSPCGDLQTAIDNTEANGMVTCLDDGVSNSNGSVGGGDVAAINIQKSITIDCLSTASAIWLVTVSGGTNVIVTLRNMTIQASGGDQSGGIGVNFQSSGALFIEHCVIQGWNQGTGAGIYFAPTSGVSKLHVTDSVIKNNGVAAGGAGIFVSPASGAQARVAIERTVVENNTYGVFANGTGANTLVEIKDSTIANNAINGIWAYTSGATSSIMVDHSVSNYNGGSGAFATGTGAFVSLSDSTVVGNATGLSTASGGSIGSYGNNRINGNVSAGVTPTSIAVK